MTRSGERRHTLKNPSAARLGAAGGTCMVLLSTGCVPHLTSPGLDDSGVVSTWVAPDNGWSVAQPPAGLTGQGYGIGQVMPDFLLMDQNGDQVSLWQFYGSVVVVDISTMWCGPCATIADAVTDTWREHESQGFMYLTLLPEDTLGQVPDQKDLQRWASDHSIEAPVLQDGIGRSYEMAPDAAYPRIYVVDRDMTVAVDRVNPADDASIQAAVEALL